ncbi:L,D-transpeptidase [Actinophytocola sp.]|uniref:L,D-transpeptidase n=1 Tax=Actinophytocola sp. TaxID=1872138 RepID=UPI003D6C0C7E
MRVPTMIAALAVAGAGLLCACATADSAAPPPSTPAPTTSPSTTAPPPKPGPTTMRELPEVVEANATIVKEPPPPPAGVPCDGGAAACVDLSSSQAWLLAGGEVALGPVPITHGRAGYETPPGTFNVGWKDIDHLSSEFDNAPMPYSVFFNGGIAFHEGSLSDLSHGCIHLSGSAARAFYEGLAVGDVVRVVT